MSSRRPLLKIIILGDSGVGKTSLMHQYVNKKFDGRYKATIGADFLTKDVEVGGQTVTLQIWDTAGQERFQSLGSAFYRGADACVLVFDVTRQESFAHVGSWLDEFTVQAGRRDSVLVGNKTDLADRRQVAADEARRWCGAQGGGMRYVEASARHNSGVEESFLAVAAAALAQKSAADDDVVLPQSISLSQRPRETSGGSCAC